MSAARLATWAALAVLGAGCVPLRYADCGSGMVRLEDDPDHCGACHASCPGGAPCVRGRCRVPEGATVCRDATDPNERERRQGASPEPRSPACAAGESGASGCRVVDPWSDPRHCGGCGRACAEGERCVDGRCVADLEAVPAREPP